MDEGKLWHRINPGGKTKEAFEKGEITQAGRPASAEELTRTLDKVRKIRAGELKAKEGIKKVKETPKNPEEIEFIGMVQMMIGEERARLGLAPGFYIESERTRLFHPEDWKARDSRRTNDRGEYRILADLAETQTKSPNHKFSPYAFFKTISHELLHQASYNEADPLGHQMGYRLGYMYKNGWGCGLNEGMTEDINLELLARHEDTLQARFPENTTGRPFKWWAEFPSYHVFRKVVRAVAKSTDDALYSNTTERVTWNNLKRGYFSGDDRALEDIEKALGKEALELLLLLGNEKLFNTDNAVPEKTYWHIERQIERYLTDRLSPGDKQRIYQEVMNLKKAEEVSAEKDVVAK